MYGLFMETALVLLAQSVVQFNKVYIHNRCHLVAWEHVLESFLQNVIRTNLKLLGVVYGFQSFTSNYSKREFFIAVKTKKISLMPWAFCILLLWLLVSRIVTQCNHWSV
jgi:hypothetical protein